MKYYGMKQKAEQGCPAGLLKIILYDAFYEEADAKKIDHSAYPWYVNSFDSGPVAKFPAGLTLISKEKPFDFDIRSHSTFFHLVSEDFVNVMESLAIDFEDIQRIDVIGPRRQQVTSKKYFAARFRRFKIDDALDMTLSELFPRRGNLVSDKIKKYVFLQNFNYDAFQFRGMAIGHDTVYCSSEFRDQALKAKLKGVDFIETDGHASGSFGEI